MTTKSPTHSITLWASFGAALLAAVATLFGAQLGEGVSSVLTGLVTLITGTVIPYLRLFRPNEPVTKAGAHAVLKAKLSTTKTKDTPV